MNLSYKDPIVRDYCYSLSPDVSSTPFTLEEIIAIRAHLADLRAAPTLADAPVGYEIQNSKDNQVILTISFGQIEIICLVNSSLQNPTLSQINRIQILDIIRKDLQLVNKQAKIA